MRNYMLGLLTFALSATVACDNAPATIMFGGESVDTDGGDTDTVDTNDTQDTNDTVDTNDTQDTNDTEDTNDTTDTDNASDVDRDGVTVAEGDCDDLSSRVYPGAPETNGDGVDSDCDGADNVGGADTDTDTGGDTDDTDGGSDTDGGDTDGGTENGDVDGDTFTAAEGDCDDFDRHVFPGAAEVCNGYDDNCDSIVDESGDNAEIVQFMDVDTDGYGDSTTASAVCVAEAGKVTVGGDCDDLDRNVHPGKAEITNGYDDNCDGVVDEGEELPSGPCAGDAACIVDGVLFIENTYTIASFEAHDSRYIEVDGAGPNDYDPIDAIDNMDLDSEGYVSFDLKSLNDGEHEFNIVSSRQNSSSASLTSSSTTWQWFDVATVYADTPDLFVVKVDHGSWQELNMKVVVACGGDVVAFAGDTAPAVDTSSCGSNDPDSDSDGSSDSVDCNDADATIHPGATETANGKDDDCDGSIDEGTANADTDGDGYTSTDCDNANAAIHPGATETANGKDDDCDGSIDEVDGGDTGDTGVDTDDTDVPTDLGTNGTSSLDPMWIEGGTKVCVASDVDVIVAGNFDSRLTGAAFTWTTIPADAADADMDGNRTEVSPRVILASTGGRGCFDVNDHPWNQLIDKTGNTDISSWQIRPIEFGSTTTCDAVIDLSCGTSPSAMCHKAQVSVCGANPIWTVGFKVYVDANGHHTVMPKQKL